MVKDRYINLFTDFGFKKIFGEELNKDILIDFLNELLKDREGSIKDLKYLKNEQLGSAEADRKAIFDLYCENEKGEKFIVELQKTKQCFFKDRSLYYATFPIQEQARRGNWNYELKHVYTIGILDFIFEEDKKNMKKMIYYVKLKDIETDKIFYDKLTFIYLEIPKFTKTENELKSHFEKWLFVLKNLHRLNKRPQVLQEKIFEKIFRSAEIAKFTYEEKMSYENSLKYYRDLKNSFDTARDEGYNDGMKKGIKDGIEKGIKKGIEKGIEKGIKEEKIQIAIEMIKDGLSNKKIQIYTDLSITEIDELTKSKK